MHVAQDHITWLATKYNEKLTYKQGIIYFVVAFTWQFTVEVPGVAIMRQTNRFFFCGHTSGKVKIAWSHQFVKDVFQVYTSLTLISVKTR